MRLSSRDKTTPFARWFPCRFRALVPLLMLAGFGASLVNISWFTWPDILVDSGRELYIPWRITEGEMLYRDIPHLYGPLAQYVNALIFAVFGTSLRTLAFFNLALVCVLTWLIYGIFRRACDRLTATLCGAVFLGVFAFGRYRAIGNYNFVCPYSHELTYGILLFFTLVLALEPAPSRRPGFRSAAAGVLLGLIFLTKVEVFVAALVAVLLGLCLPALHARSLRGFAARRVAAAFIGFAAPVLGFVVYFSTRATVRESLGMVAATITSLGQGPIVGNLQYLVSSGLDRPAANAALMLEATAVYAVLAVGILLLSRFAARQGRASRGGLALLAVVGSLAGGASLFAGATGFLLLAWRPLPLFLLAGFAHLSWLAVKGGRERSLPSASMIHLPTFGLALLPKIALQTSAGWYGFALAMPAALVLTAGAVFLLPRFVERRGGSGAAARIAATTLVVLCVVAHAGTSREIYRYLTWPIGAGADRFLTVHPSVSNIGPVFTETLAAIDREMSPDAGFVVIPEGIMLNYLARRRNPAGWFEFHPTYLAAIGEGRVLAALEAAGPEYVVLANRSTAEMGADYFGVDYGFRLKDWIMANYTPVFHAGDQLFSYQDFGIVIARKNKPPRDGT